MRFLLFLPVLLVAAGCGNDLSTHKGCIEAQADAANDLAAVFDRIKDTSTAKSAQSDIEACSKRMAEAQKAMMNLKEELSVSDMEKMESVGQKLAAATQKQQEAFMKLVDRLKDNPEAQAIVEKALR